MHHILIGLAGIGLLTLATIAFCVYLNRREIAQAEKEAVEQLKAAANTFRE